MNVDHQEADRVDDGFSRRGGCQPFLEFARAHLFGVHCRHHRRCPSFLTTHAAAPPSACQVSARLALRASIHSVSSFSDQPTERAVSGNGLGAHPFACSAYQDDVGMPVICRRSGSRTIQSGWLALIGSRFKVKPPTSLTASLPCLALLLRGASALPPQSTNSLRDSGVQAAGAKSFPRGRD